MPPPTPLDKLNELGPIEGTFVRKLGSSLPQPILGGSVGQKLEGGFDGGEVLSREQHDVVAAVLGDEHSLVRPVDLVGDLGELCLDG